MPHVREEASLTVHVTVARNAWRRMLNHANVVARDRRAEAIGWLLGYFSPDGVTVLDSVAVTRYVSQSRYGAQADPREELELATSYPRNVGIVGLYHSHPFRDETEHAIFHSQTDDATLKSRASRHADYLSVVTDGHEAELFVHGVERAEVRPEVVDELSYRDVLRRYACDIFLHVTSEVVLSGMEGLLAALEREASQEVGRALRAKDVRIDATKGAVVVPGLAGTSSRNAIRVTPAEGKARFDLQIGSEVVIYVPPKEENVLAVLKDEILDTIVYLLWNGLDPRTLSGPVVPLEANLGSLRVQETNPLPKKMYRSSRRAIVVRKGAA